MKNFAKLLQLIAVLFFVGSLLVGGTAFLVTMLTAGDVAGGVPLYYYENLNLQWLSILLPVLGIVAFLLVLPQILSERKASEDSTVVTFPTKPSSEEIKHQHLKAA
ncbi:MAG: hypothetical protein JST85_12760 [Acidobacteria bacterium]|nr:hypothetical protein [Acidobacteriota bacterium]